MNDYAIYKGDTFLFLGTAIECAEHLGVTVETIYFYTSPTYKRRLEKRNATNSIIAIKLEDE